MLLAGAIALLGALCGSGTRGLAVWTAAGTLGAAVGPALGGIATQLFDWRAIFALQVPVALTGLAVACSSSAHPGTAAGGTRVAANLALGLVFGALVGALFLAVLLVVNVWGLPPIAGAAAVSALPVGAMVARRLIRELAPRTAALAGALLLTGGLLALALLPATSVAIVVVA